MKFLDCFRRDLDANMAERNTTPEYYNLGEMEAMDIIDAVLTHSGYKGKNMYYVGNILKYIIRAPRKHGKEDIQKAKNYLDRISF